MFETWKESRRKEKEASWLAEIHARDADVGVPTPSTIEDRLKVAAIAGMWSIVDDCLQKGADANVKLEVARIWKARNYLRPFGKVEPRGYTKLEVPLLCVATMHGDVKAAENLLAQGADADSSYRGWNGVCSALYIAVRFNNMGMVKLLCDKGADLKSDRPLRLAEENGYNDIIKIIRAEEAKRGQGATPQPPLPATAEEKIMGDLEKLSPAAREKLLAIVNEKFAPPKPAEAVLEQGIVVQKPLTLKKQP